MVLSSPTKGYKGEYEPWNEERSAVAPTSSKVLKLALVTHTYSYCSSQNVHFWAFRTSNQLSVSPERKPHGDGLRCCILRMHENAMIHDAKMLQFKAACSKQKLAIYYIDWKGLLLAAWRVSSLNQKTETLLWLNAEKLRCFTQAFRCKGSCNLHRHCILVPFIPVPASTTPTTEKSGVGKRQSSRICTVLAYPGTSNQLLKHGKNME